MAANKSYRGLKRLSDLLFSGENQSAQDGLTPTVAAVTTLQCNQSTKDTKSRVPLHDRANDDADNIRKFTTPESSAPNSPSKRSPAHRGPGLRNSINGSVRSINRSMTKRFTKQVAKLLETEDSGIEKEITSDDRTPSPVQHSSPIAIRNVQIIEGHHVPSSLAPAVELDLPQSRLSSGSLGEFLSADRHDVDVDQTAPLKANKPSLKQLLSFTMDDMFGDDDDEPFNMNPSLSTMDRGSSDFRTMKIKHRRDPSHMHLKDPQAGQVDHTTGLWHSNDPAGSAVLAPSTYLSSLHTPPLATPVIMATRKDSHTAAGTDGDAGTLSHSECPACPLPTGEALARSFGESRVAKLINFLEIEICNHHPKCSNEGFAACCYNALSTLFTEDTTTFASMPDADASQINSLSWDVVRDVAATTEPIASYQILGSLYLGLLTHKDRVNSTTPSGKHLHPEDAQWHWKTSRTPEGHHYGPCSGRTMQDMLDEQQFWTIANDFEISPSNPCTNEVAYLYVKRAEGERFFTLPKIRELGGMDKPFLNIDLVKVAPNTKYSYVSYSGPSASSIAAEEYVRGISRRSKEPSLSKEGVESIRKTCGPEMISPAANAGPVSAARNPSVNSKVDSRPLHLRLEIPKIAQDSIKNTPEDDNPVSYGSVKSKQLKAPSLRLEGPRPAPHVTARSDTVPVDVTDAVQVRALARGIRNSGYSLKKHPRQALTLPMECDWEDDILDTLRQVGIHRPFSANWYLLVAEQAVRNIVALPQSKPTIRCTRSDSALVFEAANVLRREREREQKALGGVPSKPIMPDPESESDSESVTSTATEDSAHTDLSPTKAHEYVEYAEVMAKAMAENNEVNWIEPESKLLDPVLKQSCASSLPISTSDDSVDSMPGTHPTVEQIPSSKDLDEPSPTDNESISSEEREDRKLALDTALGKAVTPPYCAQPGIKIPSDSTVFGVPLTEKSTNTMKEHKEKHYLMKSGMSETEALEKMKAQKVLLEKLAVACEARWAQIEKEEEDEEVELEKEHQIMVAEMDNCPIEWLPIIKLPTDEAPADKSQAEFVFVEEVPKENVPVDRSQTEFVDVEELVNKHVQPDNDNETIATLNISPLQLAKEDSDDAEQKPSGRTSRNGRYKSYRRKKRQNASLAKVFTVEGLVSDR